MDIGLRKSRDIPAVHRVKPTSPSHRYRSAYHTHTHSHNIHTTHTTHHTTSTLHSHNTHTHTHKHRFSIGPPQKNLYGTTGGTKGVITLAHFTRDSTETINLRASQGSGRGFSDSDSSTIQRASSCSEYSTTSLSPKHSPNHVSRLPGHVTGLPGHVTVIPNRVPPPTGILSPATRNKDGYFVSNKTSSSPAQNKPLPVTDISFKKCGGKKNRGKKERQKVIMLSQRVYVRAIKPAVKHYNT